MHSKTKTTTPRAAAAAAAASRRCDGTSRWAGAMISSAKAARQHSCSASAPCRAGPAHGGRGGSGIRWPRALGRSASRARVVGRAPAFLCCSWAPAIRLHRVMIARDPGSIHDSTYPNNTSSSDFSKIPLHRWHAVGVRLLRAAASPNGPAASGRRRERIVKPGGGPMPSV